MLIIEFSYNFLYVWNCMKLYDKKFLIYGNCMIRSFGQPGMFKDLSMESRNIQTQNCAPIQCTVWPRNETFLNYNPLSFNKHHRFTLRCFVIVLFCFVCFPVGYRTKETVIFY